MAKINTQYLIHTVLGHSYLFYFCMLIAGVLFDIKFPHPLNTPYTLGFGLISMFCGTGLAWWAQETSRKGTAERKSNPSEQMFFKGPYAFMRSPTTVGIFLMFFGFGFVVNSFFIPLFATAAFLINKFSFIAKQEALLEKTYGEIYKNYKKKIHF